MPIQEENIVFLKSQVMDDVPEGGGAATGTLVVDGQMNNVFEDVSDLDRAYGRLNLRKLFVGVRSQDTDLYGGAKLVVTQLPDDPALGYTLFTTRDQFDQRTQAAGRVEAYLYKGPMWGGALYENHIVGMRAIQLIQPVGSILPAVGKTLCLVQDEGLAGEKEQYVRVSRIASVEVRTFIDDQGKEYQVWVVQLALSDALRHNFTGHVPTKTFIYNFTGKARVRDTTVADATTYYGSQPLAVAAASGDLRIRANSMFAQLVPAAETENPLVNQIMVGAIETTLDAGGGVSVTVSQSPHTRAIAVTAENRRLNWIERLAPLPTDGTLSISFMSGGNWYLLSESGGTIAGSDPSYGAGTLNSETGDAAVTLGALPDAGSQIMFVWASPVHYRQRLGTGNAQLTVIIDVGDPLQPGSVALTWIRGGVERSATVAASGQISGDATGDVSHATGIIRAVLDLPPDSSTEIGLSYRINPVVTEIVEPDSVVGNIALLDLGVALREGSVQCEWATEYVSRWERTERTLVHPGYCRLGGGGCSAPLITSATSSGGASRRIKHLATDDGDGGIVNAFGEVVYATGVISLPLLPEIPETSYSESGEWVDRSGSDRHTWPGGTVTVRYIAAGVGQGELVEASLTLPPLRVRVLPRLVAEEIMPGSLRMSYGSLTYEDRGTGLLYSAAGAQVGTINYALGEAVLTQWAGVSGPPNITSCLTRIGLWSALEASFRTQIAPLKPEALAVYVTATDGTQLEGIADADGDIVGDNMSGTVNYEYGLARVTFSVPADPGTLRYNAVAFSFLPLDADILGIDAVRLPSDGRVPIYRPGDVVLVMHAAETAPLTPQANTPINLGRTRLAWVRVSDAEGETVSGDLYSLDRVAGTITFPNPGSILTPVIIRHVIADLRMLSDAEISGWLTLTRGITHDYPADESLVASCLLFGDRRARVSGSWDQKTWDSVWQDSIRGDEALGTLNLIDYPIVVTNEGCDTDRWLLRVTNASANTWELISEKRGLVWSGVYAPNGDDIAPINPRTREFLGENLWSQGVPYMRIPGAANGGGWSTGNCVRINTVGAIADFWIARSIQQSDLPDDDGADGCEIYALGNVDRP